MLFIFMFNFTLHYPRNVGENRQATGNNGRIQSSFVVVVVVKTYRRYLVEMYLSVCPL